MNPTSRAPMNIHTFCTTVVRTFLIIPRLSQANPSNRRRYGVIWERGRSLLSWVTGCCASLDTSKSLPETLLLFERFYIKSGSFQQAFNVRNAYGFIPCDLFYFCLRHSARFMCSIPLSRRLSQALDKPAAFPQYRPYWVPSKLSDNTDDTLVRSLPT